MQNKKWQCKWSPTLGRLEDAHQKIWGTKDYQNNIDSTVFFGCYGLPDFYAIWRHKGEKHILWAGTDIIHFKNNYWLDDKGNYRIDRRGLAKWINKYCSSWVENKIEANALTEEGIYARIQPSFLGNIDKFEVSFKPGNKVYASVSGDNFEQYGWNKIGPLAKNNPKIEFHLYGNKNIYIPQGGWPSNVKIHGRVSQEQMNAEIKEMQGGLRMLEFDGFSEINAKSILWGQWPISLIEYPYFLKPNEINKILYQKKPNLKGRNYYRKKLNKYPWVTSKN